MLHGPDSSKYIALSDHCSRSALILLVALTACASPGPPKPPSLNLPAPVSNLIAERVGDDVQLRWITSAKTTDGLEVRGPISVAICRSVIESQPDASAAPPACMPVMQMQLTPGPSSANDHLPSTLTHEPPKLLAYSLRILNARGRGTNEVTRIFALSGTAPSSVSLLRAKASEEGAVLQWQRDTAQSGGRDAVELHRLLDPTHPPRKDASPALSEKVADSPDMLFRTPFAPSGALDRTARLGETYTYTAQRTRTVIIANRTLELRSEVSAPLSIEMRDTFPPRIPAGLEAVQGDHGIDLSWRPNTEADLTGYVVYRDESGKAIPLNIDPLPDPGYKDQTATPGHRYRYTVVAIDHSGNRSDPSEAVSQSLSPHE